MWLFLCRLQKQPFLPSNYMCCAKSTCHIFKNYNAAGFFVLFFTSLFVLLGTKWCFSFTFLILLVSVSELQSCCVGETVPRKPCGTQTTHIKTASTLHINVCHHNQTQLSLREHKDSPPQLAQGAKVDYDAKSLNNEPSKKKFKQTCIQTLSASHKKLKWDYQSCWNAGYRANQLTNNKSLTEREPPWLHCSH